MQNIHVVIGRDLCPATPLARNWLQAMWRCCQAGVVEVGVSDGVRAWRDRWSFTLRWDARRSFVSWVWWATVVVER